MNLGVGIPNLCLMFIPKDVDFTIQSENGVLGLVRYLHSVPTRIGTVHIFVIELLLGFTVL